MAFNSQMHERNIYKNRPDFAQIALNYPEFRKYALSDAKGKVRVDFTDPDALRILTKILLKKDFNLTVEIPKGFLIPTVPQRLNYILWIEDLLSILSANNKVLRGIDIGCGPCAIFSILGAKKNGWMFTSTETSQEALQWALKNIEANNLSSLIKVVKVDPNSALSGVLSSKEDYDFCLCNPPFFENMEDIRKKFPKVKETITTIVKEEEIFAEGGEVAFVKKIIEESLIFRDKVKLYTSMFGKKKSFVEIFKVLQSIKDITVTKSQFCQGNTIRWGVAWTFDKSVNFGSVDKPKPKKAKKAKPPLVHHIPKDIKCCNYNVQELSKFIWNTLKDLEILIKVTRVHEHYTESQITTDKNTWSHQRRKRRETKRSAGHTDDINFSLNKNSDVMTENNVTTSVEAHDQNTTTSISMTDDSDKLRDETGSADTSKTKSLLAEGENKDSKVAASDEFESSDKASKKRKLIEDDLENYKKLRSEKDVKVAGSEECAGSSDHISTNFELVANASKNFHKSQLGSDQSKPSDFNQCSENISTNDCDPNQLNSLMSQIIKEPKEEMMEIVNDSGSTVPNKDFKELETAKNKGTILIKAEEVSDVNFEPKSLLFSTLKIRRAKDFVLIEMHCPDEANRESMYQILQYLKNKLN